MKLNLLILVENSKFSIIAFLIGECRICIYQIFQRKGRFPNFKSRKNPVQSFQLPQHYTVDFEKNMSNFLRLEKLKRFFIESLKAI